jgi:hypothetical protein
MRRARAGWLVLSAMAFAAGATQAGAADDMWQTLRDAGKTDAQLQADAAVERRKELERRQEEARERASRKKAAKPSATFEAAAESAAGAPATLPERRDIRERPVQRFPGEPDLPMPDMAEKIGPCYHAIQKKQFETIAKILERRLLTDRSLTAAEKKVMREDAHLARQAAANTDPYAELPIQVYDRLTTEDVTYLAQKGAGFTDQAMADCEKAPPPGKKW